MQFIKEIYASLCRSLIRFFDNRFIKDNDVEYYRMEMDKLRQEKDKILEVLITKVQPLNSPHDSNEDVNWQPARQGYVSWETKRNQLEAASRLKAEQLTAEAKKNLASSKTTEELEAELLGED